MSIHFLIIDDDVVFAQTLARTLKLKGHVAEYTNEPGRFPDNPSNSAYDVVLLDLRLGAEHSLQHIPALRQRLGDAQIIVLTGFASVATAVQAMKLGANDYLAKPVSAGDILQHLQQQEIATSTHENVEPLNLKQQEWETIQRVLLENDGNISATARQLGMHRRTLQRKLDKKSPK